MPSFFHESRGYLLVLSIDVSFGLKRFLKGYLLLPKWFKAFYKHLHSIGETSPNVGPGYRCQHLVVAAAIFDGQPHHSPVRVRVPGERRVVQLMLGRPVWEEPRGELSDEV